MNLKLLTAVYVVDESQQNTIAVLCSFSLKFGIGKKDLGVAPSWGQFR